MKTKNARVPIREGNKGNINPPPKTPKPSAAPPPQTKRNTMREGADASSQSSTQSC